ncbi:MAG: hypothetical protein WA432_01260 [Candidatus Babeliaceae bacterium]
MGAYLKTFTHRLLQSWQESLLIFKPRNFKNFLLITAKSYKETVKALLFGARYFLLLIAVLLILMTVMIAHLFYIGKNQSLIVSLLSPLYYFTYYFCLFLVYCAVRPSANKKDYLYFCTFIKKFFLSFIFMIFFIHLISLAILLFLATFFTLNCWLDELIHFLYPFSLFFLLDAGNRKKFLWIFYSIGNGLKMFFYNLPLSAVIIVLFYFLYQGVMYLGHTLLFVYLISFLLILLDILYVCLFSNIYIRQIHEHFDWYYARK